MCYTLSLRQAEEQNSTNSWELFKETHKLGKIAGLTLFLTIFIIDDSIWKLVIHNCEKET